MMNIMNSRVKKCCHRSHHGWSRNTTRRAMVRISRATAKPAIARVPTQRLPMRTAGSFARVWVMPLAQPSTTMGPPRWGHHGGATVVALTVERMEGGLQRVGLPARR